MILFFCIQFVSNNKIVRETRIKAGDTNQGRDDGPVYTTDEEGNRFELDVYYNGDYLSLKQMTMEDAKRIIGEKNKTEEGKKDLPTWPDVEERKKTKSDVRSGSLRDKVQNAGL